MSLHPSTRQLIKLTTHPDNFGVDPEPLKWGERDPTARGPVVATVSKPGARNAIGSHSGSYCVYRAVALAAQKATNDFRPDFTNTLPPCRIGPFDSWYDPKRIVSLDPWGHVPQDIWADRLADGSLDLRPTIAVTKSHLDLPEIHLALKNGTLKADGVVIEAAGGVVTTKAAIDPVWYLPEVARRFGCEEKQLRRTLYEETGGMFPELVTRNDLKLFLPPINGVTMYIIGSVESISDTTKASACRAPRPVPSPPPRAPRPPRPTRARTRARTRVHRGSGRRPPAVRGRLAAVPSFHNEAPETAGATPCSRPLPLVPAARRAAAVLSGWPLCACATSPRVCHVSSFRVPPCRAVCACSRWWCASTTSPQIRTSSRQTPRLAART